MKALIPEKYSSLIEPENIQSIDKSFIASNHKEYESDLIYKVTIGEREAWVYILMEFQSTVDRLMPFRILNYVTQLYMTLLNVYDENDKKPGILPLVLYNGNANWNVSTQVADLIDKTYVAENFLPHIEYMLLDLSQITDVALEQMKGLVGAVIYAEKYGREEHWKEAHTRLTHFVRECNPKELDWFTGWFKTILSDKLSEERINQLIQTGNKEQGNMLADVMEEIHAQGLQEGEQLGLQRGEELGLQKGRQEGRQEGAHQKAVETARILLKMGLSIEQVMKGTGLSRKEVGKLLE